jgi:hypothetical protein
MGLAGMGTLFMAGHGHSWEGSLATLPASIAIYEKSAVARKFFHTMVNYLIGVSELTAMAGGWDLGCAYGQSHLKWLLYQTLYLNTALPELQITRNPFYKHIGRFFTALVPIGLPNAPWGRIDAEGAGVGHRKEVFRLLAYVANDPTVLDNWINACGQKNYLTFQWRPWVHVAAPLHFHGKTLIPAVGTTTDFLFPEAGFVMSHRLPPSDPRAFQEGVGLIFRCKASPPGGGAAFYNETNFQMYAYGESLNYGGLLTAEETSGFLTMSHNTVLVDGIGQTPGGPQRFKLPYRAALMAYKSGKDYRYMMGDATNCYPRSPYPVAFACVRFDPEVYGKKAVPHLEQFRRHVLFMHKKYVVVFDDLKTIPGTPARFSWLWHVQQEGEVVYDEATGRLTYPAGEVKVLLQHIGQPQEISYQDLEGIKAFTNPLTGEDYTRDSRTNWRMKDKRWSPYIPAHNFWFTTHRPIERFHFMTIIYPIRPGGAAPVITRLDDLTAEVDHDGVKDIISFDENTRFPATHLVDLKALRAPVEFKSPP